MWDMVFEPRQDEVTSDQPEAAKGGQGLVGIQLRLEGEGESSGGQAGLGESAWECVDFGSVHTGKLGRV